MAELVDAAVSNTVGGQPPCRFESDLRHHKRKNYQKDWFSLWEYNAELCSGSTGDFGSPSPGSNPGSAANRILLPYLCNEGVLFPGSSIGRAGGC